MPYGLEVYDENGKLINSTNTRFPRILGSFIITGNTKGSQSIQGIPSSAVPVFFIRQMTADYAANMPYIDMTSSSISWEYRQFGPEWQGLKYADCLVMWGYY